MNDAMKMGDGYKHKIECGHPNKNAGELCELCGQVVPQTAETGKQEEKVSAQE